MNSLTIERRSRFERDALDHILDQRRGFDRARMKQVIAAEAAASPAFARRRAKISQDRSILVKQGNIISAAGALAVVGAAVAMAVLGVTLENQVMLMLVGGMVLGLFRLVLQTERPNSSVLAGGWLVVSLLPFARADVGGIDLYPLALGWLAIGARSWMQLRAQEFDRDEIQLMLDAQGREAHVEQMRRQVAAAI